MGTKEIEALIAILQRELEKGRDNHVTGTWHIHFETERTEGPAFSFNKCESEVYCEERPTVIAVSGDVLDAGGPLFG